MSKEKPWYKQRWIWIVTVIVLAIMIAIPFVINWAYMAGEDLKEANTAFSASDMIGFYGSFLAFLGTVALGALALGQNQKFKKENDIVQKRLERINDKLLSLDILRENQKQFEMYFSFMEEAEKIFNPQYVLGDFTKPKQNIQIYFTIKQCKLNALAIKRRLLFLDSSNSGNDFFEYSMGKIEEAAQIAQQDKIEEEGKEVSSQLFKFMMDNGEEFNERSLKFIFQIHRLIYKEEPTNDQP